MAKTIAIANQKGGVGKTTTCVNLAASLAAMKRQVLVIDLDPQGNATVGSGIEKTLTTTINEVLLQEKDAVDVIVAAPAGFSLLPANHRLTIAEVRLLALPEREFRLKRVLQMLRNSYDFILIDCPPTLNILTVNALVAADSALIPIQCEYFALEGLAGLLNSIDRLRQTVNSALTIEGLLRTMYDPRNRLTIEVSEQLMQHFRDKVYRTAIPRNVRLAEAPSHGMPALLYDSRSQGAAAYLALAGELIQQNTAKTEKIAEEDVVNEHE